MTFLVDISCRHRTTKRLDTSILYYKPLYKGCVKRKQKSCGFKGEDIKESRFLKIYQTPVINTVCFRRVSLMTTRTKD